MIFIHEMLKTAAGKYPRKRAFNFKHNFLTYSEMDEASTRLALFLKLHGIKQGERIGIFSVKNIEEIIALFAVMKLGCIFVHINPHFKEDQLRHIISNCNLKVLFIHKSKERTLAHMKPDGKMFDLVISLSSSSSLGAVCNPYYLSEILARPPARTELPGTVKESDPAAIIYTSGSTGKPKGIIVTHRIFHDSTVISAGVLKNTADDCLISVTPFSFDGALSQLFTSVYAGGTLVLQDSNFPKDVVATLLKKKITGFHAVPSFWRMLMQRHSPFAAHRYPHLRYISIIGEAFPREEVMQLKTVLPDTEFYIMYGTTEAFRSTYLLPGDFKRKFPSVGKAFPGVEISIVNEQGGECEVGEVGEIVHSGVFVSPGYWNDPCKTRETFREGRLYTGDLGKMDKEGYLYFVGRKDVMLKSMGYRISPEEIEECLCKIPGVSEAAVCGIFDKEKGNRIKAFIVSEKEGAVTEKDIIRYCKLKLPYYMVPAVLEFRNALSKTGTYKINRAQLR